MPHDGLRLLPALLLIAPLACASGDEVDGPTFTTGFASASTTNTTSEETSEVTGDGDGDPSSASDTDPGDGDGDPATATDTDPGDGDGDMLEPDLPASGPLTINDLVPGDLVITEIMYNPEACGDQDCEWIELYNASGAELDLEGLRVQDITAEPGGIVGGELIVAAGSYVWLGKDANGWLYPATADAYTGSDPPFNNTGDDRVVVLNDLEVIDTSAAYTAGDEGIGVSWQLDANSLDATSNDNPANWCYSTAPLAGDFGSPKLANDPC